MLELGLHRGTGRLAQAQKKTAFFGQPSADALLGTYAPKTPINDKNTKQIGSDISEKNNKEKYIFRQGRMECCLQTCEISENEACGFYQKYVGSSDVERLSCGRSVPSVQKGESHRNRS